MQIECTPQQGYYLAICEGQLDDSTHRPFRDTIHPLFTDKGVQVVIDLSGAKWINSEGIAAMVRLTADANTRNCRVIFAAPNSFVQEIFAVTRLDHFFEVAPTREAAVEMLDQQSTA
jgi:anti-anti-sigma factor